MTRFHLFVANIFCWSLVAGCAQLHHVQVGNVDNRDGITTERFEVLMSETGVDVQEAGNIAKALSRNPENNDLGKIADAIALFQIGPRTGKPVFSKRYAEKLVYLIYEKCPSGNVTALMSIRETRNYPVISGEIVKVTGLCQKSGVN